MWNLRLEQPNYRVMEFEFPNLEKAVEFIETATVHSVRKLEFRMHKERPVNADDSKKVELSNDQT